MHRLSIPVGRSIAQRQMQCIKRRERAFRANGDVSFNGLFRIVESSTMKNHNKHMVCCGFSTPDWIWTSDLQSRSYQAVKRENVAAQSFHRLYTNQDRKHKKTGSCCSARASGFLDIFQSSNQTVVKIKHSFIEKPYSEIQIRGESYPEKISICGNEGIVLAL